MSLNLKELSLMSQDLKLLYVEPKKYEILIEKLFAKLNNLKIELNVDEYQGCYFSEPLEKMVK